MKICHISSCHGPEDVRIFLKECRSLREAGYDVSIVVPHFSNYEKDGVEIVGAPMPRKILGNVSLYLMLFTQFQLFRIALVQKADLYHLHDQHILFAGIVLRLLGKTVIYDVHEDYPRQFLRKTRPGSLLGRLACWGFEKWENFASRIFNGVVTVTDSIELRFQRFHPKVIQVRNYPIISEFPIGSNGHNREKKAVYVGYLSEVRGVLQMVEAIGGTPYRLSLGGSFSTQDLRRECMAKMGWDRVDYLGHLGRGAVARELGASMVGLVLLHPVQNYLDGSLPVKLFEYMAAGLPVIVSDFPLWKKIIEEADCGICVDPLNVDEIAKAISCLIANPAMANEMGLRGRRAVSEQYSWIGESQKLLSFYQTFLGKNNFPHAQTNQESIEYKGTLI